MVRLVFMNVLFLLSLLNIFRAPLKMLWYVSILTTEFCWIFFCVVLMLLAFKSGKPQYFLPTNIAGFAALVLFALPVIQAYRMSDTVRQDLDAVFPVQDSGRSAFRISNLIAGINAPKVPFRTLTYNQQDALSLDFYPSRVPGTHPCVIVIHGGSWAGGSKEQLPELNSLLPALGYHVAAINYRLAPLNLFPAPVCDVASAIDYLTENAAGLGIDADKLVLLGRSAGAQVALTAAYSLHRPSIKGVISYYGPTDMVWGYARPANPLVLDSKKIMEDYLGGTYKHVPDQYVKSSATKIAEQGAVPTLMIQGKNDCLVAYDHCNRLDRELNRLQVKHYVLRLPWATHGCDYTLFGPAGQLSTYATTMFLRSVLKP